MQISSRFACSSGSKKVVPVTFPPGCERLATIPVGHNDIDIETNQFDCEFFQARVIPLSPAKVDEQVLSLYVAEVTQAGSKSVKSAL